MTLRRKARIRRARNLLTRKGLDAYGDRGRAYWTRMVLERDRAGLVLADARELRGRLARVTSRMAG